MVKVLPIHFGVVFGCKGGGWKKKQIGPEKFFRRRHSKQSYRPGIPPCQGLKVYFGVVLGCKGGGGEEKNCLGPEKFFRGLGARNKAAQARQAKTSQGQPPRSDDLQ